MFLDHPLDSVLHGAFMCSIWLTFTPSLVCSCGAVPNAGQEATPSSQQKAPGFSVRLAADLGEFAVFVSGRPADIWWPDEVRSSLTQLISA